MKRNRLITILAILAISLPLMASCLMPESAPSDGAGNDMNDRDLVTVLNGNEPYFSAADYAYAQETGYFIEVSELDGLGRVGTCWALFDYPHMPTYDREPLDTEPTGWHQNRYDTSIVPGGWLYARAHLLAFQLSGYQDDPQNLMTGTRDFNNEGMLPFENLTADHLRDQRSHHVLYRVTPDFYKDNLLAYGVTIESDCLECDGADYCVYIANIQPSITIDYSTGRNWESGSDVEAEDPSTLPDAQDYVLNTSNGKFHLPTCRYAESMSDKNREEITAPRSWMMAHGYDPCGVCNP